MIVQGRLLRTAHEPPAPGWLRVADDGIAEIAEGDPPEAPVAGGPDAIVCPGFIDAHLHLPQIDVVGCDGMELLSWLHRVVFPAEMRWADAGFARAGALEAHRRMLSAGTLGYAGFLTSHPHSAVAALAAAQRIPLRGVAGQVLMDRLAPDALLCPWRDGGHARPARTERGRLALSVNPRFAPACSSELLSFAARRAEGGAFIQTHLAETAEELELVREQFPDAPHYTAVYDRHGLLGPRTLLAHCLHLADDEWRLVAERGCVVVHCPSANLFLRAGLFDLDAAREHGVRLALGSDVAAGPDLAMPRVARAMIETAKARSMAGAAAWVPAPAEAWQLITRGNADALGLADAGRLEPGAKADLLVLRPGLPVDEHLIGRLIYTWRERYIADRVLNGRLVGNGSRQ